MRYMQRQIMRVCCYQRGSDMAHWGKRMAKAKRRAVKSKAAAA